MALRRIFGPRDEPRTLHPTGSGHTYDVYGSGTIVVSGHAGIVEVVDGNSRRRYEASSSRRHRSHSPTREHHSSAHHRPRSSYADPRAYPSSQQLAAPAQYSPPSAQPVPTQGSYQYSKCTGRKKALCIGINYYGSRHELQGCINDAKSVVNFLLEHGFRQEDIVLLTDETSNPRQLPTHEVMINAMRWLVQDAHPHDSLFFHYSGHGTQVKDTDGDEIDGYDEAILPVDYHQNGVITDDIMHAIMVKPLPACCRLTAVYDSCHSGTALDLPYIYHTDGRLMGHSTVAPEARRFKDSPADVISLSACTDAGTSADTREHGVPVGAMSYALVESLHACPQQTYRELLRSVRAILRDRYSQKPQLSSSQRVDTGLQFIM